MYFFSRVIRYGKSVAWLHPGYLNVFLFFTMLFLLVDKGKSVAYDATLLNDESQ